MWTRINGLIELYMLVGRQQAKAQPTINKYGFLCPYLGAGGPRQSCECGVNSSGNRTEEWLGLGFHNT